MTNIQRRIEDQIKQLAPSAEMYAHELSAYFLKLYRCAKEQDAEGDAFQLHQACAMDTRTLMLRALAGRSTVDRASQVRELTAELMQNDDDSADDYLTRVSHILHKTVGADLRGKFKALISSVRARQVCSLTLDEYWRATMPAIIVSPSRVLESVAFQSSFQLGVGIGVAGMINTLAEAYMTSMLQQLVVIAKHRQCERVFDTHLDVVQRVDELLSARQQRAVKRRAAAAEKERVNAAYVAESNLVAATMFGRKRSNAGW